MSKKERNKEIVKKYLVGTGITELAKEYKISKQRIDQILIENNTDKKPSIERQFNINREDLLKMVNDGMSLTMISRKLGCGRTRIGAYCRTNNITSIKCIDVKLRYSQKYDVEKIISEYQSGVPVVTIANNHGIHIHTFHKIKRTFLSKDQMRFGRPKK